MPDAEWHFIGRLQSNKARRAVRGFTVIHSVDSFDLLRRVAAARRGGGSATPELLVQVNVSGEDVKAGLSPEAMLDRAAVDAVREPGSSG